MGLVKDFGLALISIFLVISIVIFSILGSAGMLLYSGFYEQVIDDSNIYDLANLSEIEGGDFIEIPNETLESLVEPLIDNSLSYIRGEDDELNLTLDINEESLRGFFEAQAEKIRICDEGEESFTGDDVNCRPPEKNVSEFLEEVLERNNVTILEGGSVDLKEVYNLSDSDLENVRDGVQVSRMVFYGIVLLMILFIGLIFLFTRKSAKSFLMWLGSDFFAAGILVVMFGLFSSGVLLGNLDIEDSLGGLVESAVGILLNRLSVYGFFFLFAGILIFSASFLFKSKNKFA